MFGLKKHENHKYCELIPMFVMNKTTNIVCRNKKEVFIHVSNQSISCLFNFPNKLGKETNIRIPTGSFYSQMSQGNNTVLLQKNHDLFTKSVPVTKFSIAIKFK